MTDKATVDAALNALQVFVERIKVYDEINKCLRAQICPDFPPYHRVMDSKVEAAFVEALDAALGDEWATYFLYECGMDGKVIEENGSKWPIKSVDDLRAYIYRLEGW